MTDTLAQTRKCTKWGLWKEVAF